MPLRGVNFARRSGVNIESRLTITSETVGVVHVFVAAKASKHRLTELPRHAMPSVLAGTAVLENSPGNLGQAKGIIKLPISEQPSVGSDLGAVKF